MASTPEKKVKQHVVEILKAYAAYYFYPLTMGYSSSGVPDIICCYYGQFIGIECKAGKNKTTALQDQNIARIKVSGGIVLVINEDNIHEVKAVLEKIRSAHQP